MSCSVRQSQRAIHFVGIQDRGAKLRKNLGHSRLAGGDSACQAAVRDDLALAGAEIVAGELPGVSTAKDLHDAGKAWVDYKLQRGSGLNVILSGVAILPLGSALKGVLRGSDKVKDTLVAAGKVAPDANTAEHVVEAGAETAQVATKGG